MRTEQIKEFELNLSDLNDCYSHYIFVWEQFSIDQAETIKKFSDKFTIEIYKGNSNSKQLNVSLSYLGRSHDETQNLILKSIYLLAYGYFENFLIRLHQFGQELDSRILDLQQKIDTEDIEDRKVFDKFLNRLNIDSKSNFDLLEIKTLDYFRLRRNRIIHRATSTQGTIIEIINYHGKELNDFWDEKLRNKRYCIDFTRKTIDEFDKLELFDILNIYRKLASKIDQLFIDKIGLTTIRNYILEQFIKSNSKDIKGFKDARKKSKFKMYCKTKFGYDITDYELEEIYFTVV
jgi:hypothetical protein